jgi:hypothetical protein
MIIHKKTISKTKTKRNIIYIYRDNIIGIKAMLSFLSEFSCLLYKDISSAINLTVIAAFPCANFDTSPTGSG